MSGVPRHCDPLARNDGLQLNRLWLFDKFAIILRRPGECRDPYVVPFVLGTLVDAFRNRKRRWLWVPAFAGTTKESASAFRQIHQDALASSYDEISIRLPSGSRQ